MPDAHIDILFYALRVLFLILAPLVIVTTLAGLCGTALQTVTGISEPAISYTMRLLALLILGYFLSPYAIELLASLVQMVYEQ